MGRGQDTQKPSFSGWPGLVGPLGSSGKESPCLNLDGAWEKLRQRDLCSGAGLANPSLQLWRFYLLSKWQPAFIVGPSL